ncbi:hypothetical protein EJ05DRAFT_504923 [Pseudovirgaria hyperparasitica]|uniref:Uncharacterized protein n=1 Tax=Pseudovirgaria hyperparasitica TaxID=470096 RepID=A0A6A6VUH8_9PEZI|nr:uncharacterized protein EJ05DRAFT_504923 [Pseudovirgaria hyperparasitica]KAF2753270.1 hypothetical protein EJ05DRAFT_504923 [Pseudovirgaria hyperparasitica]
MHPLNDDIDTNIDFIANDPLYVTEKPFVMHPLSRGGFEKAGIKTSNVQWDSQFVTVESMRGREDISLETNGFCYVDHTSICIPREGSEPEAAASYCRESEELLKDFFKAEYVHCYDFKMRKNTPMILEEYDPNDRMLVEGAAVGAHVGIKFTILVWAMTDRRQDISIDTVAAMIHRILRKQERSEYLKPDYRFRLINTWRSTLPECQDNPLALCDYSTIEGCDLVATDRVYPTWVQEIYHLKYNKNQKWYWLPKQRANEPFLFVTYDSHAGSNARLWTVHISQYKTPVLGRKYHLEKVLRLAI